MSKKEALEFLKFIIFIMNNKRRIFKVDIDAILDDESLLTENWGKDKFFIEKLIEIHKKQREEMGKEPLIYYE